MKGTHTLPDVYTTHKRTHPSAQPSLVPGVETHVEPVSAHEELAELPRGSQNGPAARAL